MNTSKISPGRGSAIVRTLKPHGLGLLAILLGASADTCRGQGLPFVISTQPSDQVVAEGGSTTFNVSGYGTQPLSFQWRREGVDLLGATNSTLSIPSVQITHAGDYAVTVSNAAGVVTSRTALLSVGLGRVHTNAQGRRLPYRLFPPRHYNPALQYPLVLFWHGSGQSGTDNLSQLNDQGQFVFLSFSNQTQHPCFFLSPQVPQVSCDNDFAFEDQTVELLQALEIEFGIDPDRLHVTGLSMGGFISWNMIARYPDLFAGAIPMSAGWACPIFDLYLGIRIPVWNFHAANDTAVPVSYSDDAVAWLRNAGGNPIYTRYRGGGHVIWRTAYNTPGLVDWVMAQTRGAASTTPPLVTITLPAGGAHFVSPSASLDLAGTAAHMILGISQVTVTNALNGFGGAANGTTLWSIDNLPLETGSSNVIVVTARGVAPTGGTTTFNDTLTVQVAQAPEIVTQPANQATRPGIPVSLCVTATGTPTPAYQWRKDGTNLYNGGSIAGATSACLTISNGVESDSGGYSVVVSNLLGMVTSSNATLRITPLDHFVWSAIPSPQIDQAPFPVTITAEDYRNRRVNNFNDCLPLSSVTVRSNNVGQGSNLVNFPLGAFYHDERTQAIYPAEEIAAAGRITALSLDVVTPPGQTLNAWTIRMKHTPLVAYTNFLWEGGGWTTVYQTNLSVTTTGWVTFRLTTPFDYNGVDSLMVDFSFNNSTWTHNGYCRATSHRVFQALYYQTDSGYGDPLTWSGTSPGPFRSGYTPNLRLTMEGGPPASIQPSVACFTNGIWSGWLTVQAPATNLILQADDGFGHSGWSNPFNVLPSPPILVAQPTNLVVSVGGTARYCVTAVGTDPLFYAWQRDGAPILWATNSCYATSHVQFSDSGSRFSCLVSNAYGVALSSNALLVVNRPPVADASATPPVVISANATDAQAILDGTRSADPDGDLLQYLWFHTLNAQPSTLLASGAVAVVVLPVGTHPIELIVSDGMLSATNPVTVEVITTSQAVQRLMARVSSSWPAYPPLVATLRSGLASVERGDAIPAINQLLAFQNKARAQVAPTDPALAARFTDQAQEIIDVLTGGHTNPGGRPHGRFASVSHQPNGRMRLQFAAERGSTYILEASTNLMHWEMIGVAHEQGDGTFTFEDANAARFPARYYRVVSP